MLVDTSDEEAMTKAGGVGGGGDGASLEEQVTSPQRRSMGQLAAALEAIVCSLCLAAIAAFGGG